MASFTFTWPAGPNEVIVTGTFDNWQKTLPLVKKADQSFELTVPFPKDTPPVSYKYVVDGEWLVLGSAKSDGNDPSIRNNYFTAEDLNDDVSVAGGAIPESGGLKTTVMPSEEGIQKTLGEPGVVVPKDPGSIAAFKEISTVDPKSLNKEEPASAPVTNDVVIPEDPSSVAAFNEVSNVDPKSLNQEEPVANGKKVKKVKKLVKKKTAEEELRPDTEPEGKAATEIIPDRLVPADEVVGDTVKETPAEDVDAKVPEVSEEPASKTAPETTTTPSKKAAEKHDDKKQKKKKGFAAKLKKIFS
ncbi:BA75_03924T0 [Komagataella pastoris]|uniref:BA75_03924T0 n=1 Tax=Komagataella pastoris TaxID=4922 RepID=A0A1B2JEZ2_PICPA|nr:BA75_03924T0 [Komagataella pastoris]